MFRALYPDPTSRSSIYFFFFNDTATTEIYTLSLHDALPIFGHVPIPGAPTGCVALLCRDVCLRRLRTRYRRLDVERSEEHTSELQSPCNLVCRLLLEKKKRLLIQRRSYPDCSNQPSGCSLHG